MPHEMLVYLIVLYQTNKIGMTTPPTGAKDYLIPYSI
jgi:hypothetical protein